MFMHIALYYLHQSYECKLYDLPGEYQYYCIAMRYYNRMEG